MNTHVVIKHPQHPDKELSPANLKLLKITLEAQWEKIHEDMRAQRVDVETMVEARLRLLQLYNTFFPDYLIHSGGEMGEQKQY